MTQTADLSSTIEEDQITRFSTKIGISIILSFGIILAIVSFGFVTIGMFTSQITGVRLIPINLITISLALGGAVLGTYYYHTRYVRRELILNPDGFCLKIGKRSYEYSWSDFSIVALSVSTSHYGAKGYVIKLFKEDLEGDYVDLP
ncbi:MAG: hypothetical protein ACFFCU_12970, partial [Promethearchaeota archaeon]